MRPPQSPPHGRPPRRRGYPRLTLLAPIALLAACKASVSLNVETPTGAADGSISTTTAVSTPRPIHIVRTGDKLHYENGEIEFETGSAELKGASTTAVLDEFAAVLRRFPELTLRIEGHTDSRGSTTSNQKLSEARARAIVAALVARGVAARRLSSAGLGESHPARPEPATCRNHSGSDKPAECVEIWAYNRRAAFVVIDGAETLPAEGAAVSEAAPKDTVADARPAGGKRRPDWALRLFGGYSLALPAITLHGGHFGVGVHASQRFGARRRGYIGGGPRLHYRGLVGKETVEPDTFKSVVHQIGPEGNLLVGGGSKDIVGLFSLRLGLGPSFGRSTASNGVTTNRVDTLGLGGWLLGGVVVLGKLSPRWSLGGHAEAGIIGISDVTFAVELGLNVAWHFGRGRRDGI